MKFYVCEHCGNIVTFLNNTGVPVMCCGEKMQETIKTVDGVNDAVVNYMTQKLTVDFADGADEKKVLKEALKVCRKKVDDDIEIDF